MAAIDPRPSKRRWDNHPRVARKKPQPVALDDPEAYLRIADEKQFRAELWHQFAKFARELGGFIITPPSHSPVRLQLVDGSPLLERLAQLPRYPVVKLPNVSHRLAYGRFVPVREIEVQLWR